MREKPGEKVKEKSEAVRADPTQSSLNIPALSERVRGILENPSGDDNIRFRKTRTYSLGNKKDYLDIPGEGKFYLVGGMNQQFVSMLVAGTIKRAEIISVVGKGGHIFTYSRELELDDISDPVYESVIRGESLALQFLFEDDPHNLDWKKSREPREFSGVLAQKTGNKYQHYLHDFGEARARFTRYDERKIYNTLNSLDQRTRGRALKVAEEKIQALEAAFAGPLGQRLFVAILDKLRSYVKERVATDYSKEPKYQQMPTDEFKKFVNIKAIQRLERDLDTDWGDIKTEIGAKRNTNKYYQKWLRHIENTLVFVGNLRRENEEHPEDFRSYDQAQSLLYRSRPDNEDF